MHEIQVKNITLTFSAASPVCPPVSPCQGRIHRSSPCMIRVAQTYFGVIFGTILECIWVVKVFKKGN